MQTTSETVPSSSMAHMCLVGGWAESRFLQTVGTTAVAVAEDVRTAPATGYRAATPECPIGPRRAVSRGNYAAIQAAACIQVVQA